MKKAIVLLLFVYIHTLSYALDGWQVSDKTINITATVGRSFVIDPAEGLGLPASRIRLEYSKTVTPTDANGSVVITTNTVGCTVSSVSHYNVYTITPTQTGTFTMALKMLYCYHPSGNMTYSSYATVTYIVKIVDLTNISLPQSIDLYVGDEYTFNPIISSPEAYAGLTWQSADPSVVTVDEEGNVKAVGLGTTTITCSAFNGVTSQSQITVKPTLVSGITLNHSECTMAIEDNLLLTASVAPENATDKSVSWSSSNEDIAVVDENGLVTAVSTGTCTIKATANDGSGKTSSCKIMVMRNDRLTLKDMALCAGGYDVLHVGLKNEDNIYGFQFDLALPEGISVSEDENGKLFASLADCASTHTISASKVSDGLYRFVVVSLSGKSISPQDSEIMSIAVKTTDEIPNGQYDITLKSIGLTVKNGSDFEELHPLDKKATLTIAPVVPGDVNGDSSISVTDVISIISYVLEERPNKFLTPAADLNDGGNITVTDAISVIDKILGK